MSYCYSRARDCSILCCCCCCCSPVLPHRIPEEPRWPAFPYWISKSSSLVLVFGAVGNLAFQSHGRILKLVRGESGSWTELGLHCLSSRPLLCSFIFSLSHVHSPWFFFFPFLPPFFWFFKSSLWSQPCLALNLHVSKWIPLICCLEISLLSWFHWLGVHTTLT